MGKGVFQVQHTLIIDQRQWNWHENGRCDNLSDFWIERILFWDCSEFPKKTKETMTERQNNENEQG